MYQNSSLLDKFKEVGREKKILYIGIAIISLILLFLFCAWLTGTFYYLADNSHSRIYHGLHSALKFTLIVYIVLLAFVFFTMIKTSALNFAIKTDTRGVAFMKNGVKGTAHFANKDEIEEYFRISADEDTDEIIYGQLTENGEEVVSYKERIGKAPGTRHVLLMANSGSGKSFTFTIPNVLQAIKRKHSAIISDPSGEIYSATGSYARDFADDVKVLNLANVKYSDFWNIVEEVIDPETERVDSTRLDMWGKTFMMNSPDSDKKDYYYVSAQNLIESAIAYASYLKESFIIRNYILLYQKITRTENSRYVHILKNKMVSFRFCEQTIIKAAKDVGEDLEEVKFIINEIKNNAPRFSINEVYNIIYHFNDYAEKISQVPEYHPASRAYQRFITQEKETTRSSAIQGAQARFKIFDNDNLREALSYDGIDLKTINQKQTIVYVIVPDSDNTLTPIASLFFSFFFKDTQVLFDENNNKSKEDEKNPCIPVMAMLDEFASLGVITGDKNLFGTIMSDARKRDVYICIIIQTYSQLEGNYGEFVRDSIQSNCTTKILMGAGDIATMRYWSQLVGVATAMDEKHGETQGLLGSKLNGNSMTVGSTQRDLMTIDEVGKIIDEVHVNRQGCSVFKLKPYPWIQHPAKRNGLCPKASYFDMPTIEDRLLNLQESYQKDPDVYINKLITDFKLTHVYVQPFVMDPGTNLEEVEEQQKKEVKEEITNLETNKKKRGRKKKKPSDIDAIINDDDSQFFL